MNRGRSFSAENEPDPYSDPYSRSSVNRSPGAQSNATHNATSVEKRIARPFPRLRIDRLASVIPTSSDNSVSVILRCTSSKSRLILMMAAISDRQRLFLMHSDCFAQYTRQNDDCEAGKYSTNIELEGRVQMNSRHIECDIVQHDAATEIL